MRGTGHFDLQGNFVPTPNSATAAPPTVFKTN
jgi:hypothetical protein